MITQQAQDQGQEPKISSKRLRRLQYKINGELNHFQTSMKNILATTRFNNETWNENTIFRNKHPNLGCIYPTPEANNTKISPDTIIFVLEMNNTTNRIMGIGMVRNHAFIKKHRVYSNENYNRYSYLGKNRIDRQDMSPNEEALMRALDIICFTGSRHMKRLQGIKQFPTDILYKYLKYLNIIEFVGNMFKQRLSQGDKINKA